MIGTTVSHSGILEKLDLSHSTLIVLSVFISLLNNVAFSQRPLNFDRITQREGLTDPSVISICQDASGAMWFGTDQGVERYDGYAFRTFKIGTVRDMCADDRGYIWMVSWEVGLYCFDIANDTLISYVPAPDDQDRQNRRWVSSVYLDRGGILWVGTMAGEGVLRFDTEKRRFLGPLDPPLTWDGPSSIRTDDAENLWFGMSSGILKYNKSCRQVNLYELRIHSYTVNIHVAFGRDGKIWVNGGHRQGLVWLDTARHEWHRILLRGKTVFASDVMLDDAGRVWVTTATDGLKIYDPTSHTWEEYHHRSSDPQSLTSDRIQTMYRDKIGNLWFGTRNGVSKIARWRKQFWSIPHNTDDPNSPPKPPIRSICEDHNGNIWIASFGDGVKMWNRRTGIFKSINGIGNDVHVVHSDSSGRVWIASENPHRLIAINPETGQRRIFKYDMPDTLSVAGGPILSLSDDVDGLLCIGTGNGEIAYLDPQSGKCTRLARPTPPMQGWDTRSFYVDKEGKRWSSFGGVLLVVSGIPRHATLVQPPVDMKDWEWVIQAMYEDWAGRFWVGTIAGFGLFDRTNGRLTYLRRNDRAYQSFATYGMLSDDHANLWLMTTEGVTRFRPETKEFKDFGIADGYPPTNISVNAFYGTSAYCRTKDGFLVFGTGEGIALFHPDSLHENPNPPNVIITDLKIAGTAMPLRMSTFRTLQALEFRPIELTHDQNSVIIDFAALDYTVPSQNAYSHRLEGVEDNWTPASKNRRAEYINLSPGTYVFRVKASNNDGVWNEEGAFMKITLLPPWWMTWWFRWSMVGTGMALIALIMHLWVHRAVERERLRLQIASDLHDDIGSSLSSIALVSENVRDVLGDNHPVLSDLDSVTRVARQAAERLRDDVWIIKPGSDSLENLVLRMKDVTQSVIGHIQHSFTSDTDRAGRQVPLEFRRNILLIHKEALHNILKHSRATNVHIFVGFADGTFTLDVRDNGKGFDVKETPTGSGLVNMKRRADVLGGKILIESVKGEGTHIHFEVKIPRTRY